MFPPPARFIAALALATQLVAAVGARADVISTSIAQGSLPPSSATLTAISIAGLTQTNTATIALAGGNQLTLSTPSGEGIVTRSATNYADPVAGGTAANPVLWAGNFLSTGTGTVTFTFSEQEQYFGLLWGSDDNYNSLELLKNGVPLTQSLGPTSARLVPEAGVMPAAITCCSTTQRERSTRSSF